MCLLFFIFLQKKKCSSSWLKKHSRIYDEENKPPQWHKAEITTAILPPPSYTHTFTHMRTLLVWCDRLWGFSEFFLCNNLLLQSLYWFTDYPCLLFLKVRNAEGYSEGKRLPIITECIDQPLLLFGLFSSNIVSKPTVSRQVNRH